MDAGEETAFPVGVACRPGLLDDQQQAISVAIDAQLDEVLNMPRGFAFDPERLP